MIRNGMKRIPQRLSHVVVAVLLGVGLAAALLSPQWWATAAPDGLRTASILGAEAPPVLTCTLEPATTSTEPSTTSTQPATTSTQPATTSTGPEYIDTITADVVIYGTTTSGIGALRGLQFVKAAYPQKLHVVIVAGGPHMESPIAQGLAVEDLYNASAASGFYREFRDSVINEYAAQGINVAPSGRLTVEPEVAGRLLRWCIDYGGKGRPGVSFIQGRLAAADDADERFVEVNTPQGCVRINTRYFIDASPEGDLARLLGASYRMGRSEDVFNDEQGQSAPRPTQQNDWSTSPQSMSVLLTLRMYPSGAPSVAILGHPSYYPLTYGVHFSFSEWARSSFATSWSMQHVLPNNKRELNEAWGDYTDPDASYDWVMYPEKRIEIRATIQNWILNKVEWLRTHGYPQVGVATVPTRPYVRDGVRVVGSTTYTYEDIIACRTRESVACGVYALWDRHDTVYGSRQNSQTAYVHVPMASLMAAGHPYLLASTAISTDAMAQCSAVRMEPVRANLGGAAGIITGIAAALGIPSHDVPYELVKRELLRQGYLF